MARIAFCLTTNRPWDLEKLGYTFHNAIVPWHCYVVCANLQLPEYDNHGEILLRCWLPAQVELRRSFCQRNSEQSWTIDGVETGPFFDFARARLASLKLAGDDCDFLIAGNDDYRFNVGTGYSAGDRYLDCIEYLQRHASCGIVICKSFFGGWRYGRKILPMNGGAYGALCGMVMRNPCVYGQWIDERLIAPGVCEEAAMCVTAIANGYYVAKAFNTPVSMKPDKKVILTSGYHNAKATYYSSDVIEYTKTKGVLGRMENMFDYRWPGKLSSKLVAQYRQRADALGHEPVY